MKHTRFVIICLNLFYFFIGSVNCSENNNRNLKYNLINEQPDLYITPMSEKIGHTWTNGLVWDKELIQKFYSLLPKNEFFVAFDLGAQTGSFTLLAKYFPKSIWYAFEPIKEAAETLKENLTINDIKNVNVFQYAVTNSCNNAVLQMPAMNDWGLSTIGPNALRFSTATKREVECIDLDSFVIKNNVPKVHFMKLDTEGSELSILKGAQKTIIRDRPVILMEYNETNMKQCNVNKIEIDKFLKEMNYEWKLISSEDILCVPIK